MAETRPTGEQLRFVSAATGEHILDAYLEAAEKGGRQLPDMLADIYDPITGLFRADLFEFRVAADLKLQFRVGDFADLVTGWRDVEGSPFLFFRPRGTWATSTQYAITDLVTYQNATYYALSAHTSTSTFDPTKWSLILDDTALDAAIASAQASASTATTQATNAAASAATATTQASNAQTSATNAAASQSAAATSASNAAASASTATTKASEALASATAAAASASTASTQASNASTSATNAANSASAASASASAAATSAANASTSETNAASSASSASTSASNAATSATNASNSATSASTSASNAATSDTNAAASATLANDWATKTSGTVAGGEYSAKYHAQQAASSASAAATSASNAAASYDSFDDRYLGSKTSDPALDNDGNALLTGALYWNSTASEMRVYTGSAWVALSSVGGASTLDDLTDVAITSPATGDLLRYNGTVFANYAGSNFAAAAHAHAISDITNLQTSLDAKLDDSQATAFGLSLLDDADAAAARTTLGLGTAALEGAGYFATAVHSHAISDVTNLQTSLDAKINTSAIGSTVQAYDADLDAIAALAGTSGFLKKTAANTWSLDTAAYLTANQTITLSGDLSGSGSTSISATIAAGSVTTTKLGGDITTAGKALLDDADAAAQRTTLQLGALATVSSVALASQVSGTLPVANGGTGVTSSTGTGSIVLSASPALTGTPTAPSAAGYTNTTQIATTAQVYDTVTTVPENAQTGTSYTLVLSDAGKMVTLSNAAAITLTIPTNASVAFPVDTRIDILQYGAGQVTVGGAGVTIRSSGSKLKLAGQYSGATLWKKDTNEWVLIGDIAS